MVSRLRHLLGLALPALSGGMLGFWPSVSSAADKPVSFRTATWEELVPKDWDPLKHFRGRNVESHP